MGFFNSNSLVGHHYYKKFVNSNSVILDIGGNIGEFSRSITEEHKCSSFAVEPHPDHFRKIPENDRIKKFNYAISDKCGEIFLYLHDTNPMGHTILEGRAKCGNEIRVPTVTLENFIQIAKVKKIDILKIDIEGAEIKLFDSTPSSILKQIKQITLEFHAFDMSLNLKSEVDRVINNLKRIGFYYIDFTKKNTDVLFLNKAFYSFFDYLKIKYFAKNLERVYRKLKRFGLLK